MVALAGVGERALLAIWAGGLRSCKIEKAKVGLVEMCALSGCVLRDLVGL